MAEPAAKTEVPAQTETAAPAAAAAEATPAAAAATPAAAAPPAKAAAPAKKSYSTDPALYIYTSLTAGSSHIVTATSRLETILKANRVPFKALDIAVDEKARMLWGRRAGKDESGRVRKLPGLVQMGMVLGDLFEIEEWNEYGELKQHVKIYYDEFTIPAKGAKQIPNKLKKPVYGNHVAPSKAAGPPAGGVATAATSSGPPKNIPAAPPLPQMKTGAAATAAGGANKAAGAASTPTAPTKSIAEQAAEKAEQKAQKAKQARLETLRAKVHGAKEAREKQEAAAAAGKDGASDEKKSGEDASASSASPSAEAPAGAAALQSPTSGAWKSSASQEDSLRDVLQSPTSGTWKAGDTIVDLPVREHRGSSIVEASKEEIAAIEKAEAIQEAAVESSSEEDETKK